MSKYKHISSKLMHTALAGLFLATHAAGQISGKPKEIAGYLMKSCKKNEYSWMNSYTGKEMDFKDKVIKLSFHDMNKNDKIDGEDSLLVRVLDKKTKDIEDYCDEGLDGFSTEKGSGDSYFAPYRFKSEDGKHTYEVEKIVSEHFLPEEGTEIAQKYDNLLNKISSKLSREAQK